MTAKDRQNALATSFSAGKFPCVRAFPTLCQSAHAALDCGALFFAANRRSTVYIFHAKRYNILKRLQRGDIPVPNTPSTGDAPQSGRDPKTLRFERDGGAI